MLITRHDGERSRGRRSARITGGMGGFPPTTFCHPGHYNSSTCGIPRFKNGMGIEKIYFFNVYPPFYFLLIRALGRPRAWQEVWMK